VGLILAMLWAVALAAVLLFPLMFPLIRARHSSARPCFRNGGVRFLNLYIPTNPFNSLANNVVPAVVLFSIVVGSAHRHPNKGTLERARHGRTRPYRRRQTLWWHLTPIGVFAIAAVVAGTLSFELRTPAVYVWSVHVGVSMLTQPVGAAGPRRRSRRCHIRR
jgi:Na+/H+-dicarboxylate symporter